MFRLTLTMNQYQTLYKKPKFRRISWCENFVETLRYQKTRAVAWRCSAKQLFSQNFAKFTRKHLCQSLFFKIKLQASGLKLFSRLQIFKIGVMNNFANVTGKNLCWSLFLIKLQAQFWMCYISLLGKVSITKK